MADELPPYPPLPAGVTEADALQIAGLLDAEIERCHFGLVLNLAVEGMARVNSATEAATILDRLIQPRLDRVKVLAAELIRQRDEQARQAAPKDECG